MLGQDKQQQQKQGTPMQKQQQPKKKQLTLSAFFTKKPDAPTSINKTPTKTPGHATQLHASRPTDSTDTTTTTTTSSASASATATATATATAASVNTSCNSQQQQQQQQQPKNQVNTTRSTLVIHHTNDSAKNGNKDEKRNHDGDKEDEEDEDMPSMKNRSRQTRQKKRTRRIIEDDDDDDDNNDDASEEEYIPEKESDHDNDEIHDSDDDDDEAENEDKHQKRQRGKKKRIRVDESEEDEVDDERDRMSIFEKKTSATSRIERVQDFKYSSTSSKENNKTNTIQLSDKEAQKRAQVRQRFLDRFSLDESNHENHQEEEDSNQMQVDNDDEDPNGNVHASQQTPSKKSAKSNKTNGKSTPTSAKKTAGVKYTPLEQQYLEIRKKYPDCLLVVEVGYKFRFFEQDALIASKELNIVAYMDKNMRGASIPTHRLNVHVKKLVELGYKVGIVRQMETAAIKAAGDNRSAPFERKLTHIFTRGTFIDDINTDEPHVDEKSSYIICIHEEASRVEDEKVILSIVAVQLSTGDIIHDTFQDNFMRCELETRLEHIQPTEIILPFDSMSSVTEKLIAHWALKYNDGARIERIKNAYKDVSTARTLLSEFYERRMKAGINSTPNADAQLYNKVLDLPGPIIVCMSALHSYLTEFGLEHALLLTKSFEPFSSVGHMILSGSTLSQLEIFQGGGDSGGPSGVRGSLLWVLDHTITRFGSRLLRKWMGRPLVKISDLNLRVDAVEELIKCELHENQYVLKMKMLLGQLPDIEKHLAKIHYGRCTPSDIHSTLSCLEKIATSFPDRCIEQFESPLLKTIFKSPSSIRDVVQDYLHMFDAESAKKNDKKGLFHDQTKFPEIAALRLELEDVERGFKDILKGIRTRMGKSELQYTSVSGTDYLIELKANASTKIPSSWIKVNCTKAVARYHTPEVLEKMKERDLITEQLTSACNTAFASFVKEIAELHYQNFRDVVQSLATIDCLLSMAKVASQPGYSKPAFSEEALIEVKNGRHPMVEALVSNYVPNDITLNMDERCLLITGPNMGGKSSYIRQVALIALMGQMGSYVPADSAKLGIFDSIHTRMGACDDITRGQSTFMKELQETSDILHSASARSLVILDELGRGTSTHDGTAIAYATLRYLVESVKCMTLFVTHYPILGELESQLSPALRCAHMGFLENNNSSTTTDNSTPSVTFLFKLTKGLAMRSYGLNVARLASLPSDVIKLAGIKSEELETAHARETAMKRSHAMIESFTGLWGGNVNYYK